MNNIRPKNPPHPQKKYRRNQSNKGLVRFELQIPHEAKDRFEAMVKVAADEYREPFSERRRMAKARIQVFHEITQGITHEFFALKDQIQALKAEIRALSPQFFKSTGASKTPLPEAIRALSDDPEQLKALLATTYQEAQRAKQESLKYQRLTKQYEELYEVASNYNEELTSKIECR